MVNNTGSCRWRLELHMDCTFAPSLPRRGQLCDDNILKYLLSGRSQYQILTDPLPSRPFTPPHTLPNATARYSVYPSLRVSGYIVECTPQSVGPALQTRSGLAFKSGGQAACGAGGSPTKL